MALYIMYISCVFPIKFFKNPFKHYFAHSRSLIFDLYNDKIAYYLRGYIYFGRLWGIFYGIVQNIDDHIGKMHIVCQDLRAFRIKIGMDISAPIRYYQFYMGCGILNNIMYIYPILIDIQLVFFQLGNSQYIFYLGMHPLVFVPYHLQIPKYLVLIIDYFRVFYGFHRQIYGGNGRFKLMGHIIDEVGFDLRDLFLLYQLIDGTGIGHNYDQSKRQRQYGHTQNGLDQKTFLFRKGEQEGEIGISIAILEQGRLVQCSFRK